MSKTSYLTLTILVVELNIHRLTGTTTHFSQCIVILGPAKEIKTTFHLRYKDAENDHCDKTVVELHLFSTSKEKKEGLFTCVHFPMTC